MLYGVITGLSAPFSPTGHTHTHTERDFVQADFLIIFKANIVPLHNVLAYFNSPSRLFSSIS